MIFVLNCFIFAACRATCTVVQGVFAAGDVQDSTYRQAVTSAEAWSERALQHLRLAGLQMVADRPAGALAYGRGCVKTP